MLKRSVVLFLGVAACTGRVAVSKDGLTIQRDGQAWLTTVKNISVNDKTRRGDAYAPFAATTLSKRSVESVFGAFRFEETIAPYSALTPQDVQRQGDDVTFSLGGGAGSISLDERGDVLIDWSAPGYDRVAMSFTCEEAERFFGMGAQVSIEHTGRRVPVWVSEQGVGKKDYPEISPVLGFIGAYYDSYAPIPFTVSSAHRAFFIDSPARSELELCENGAVRIESDGPHFRLRVSGGASMQSLVLRFAAATGTPPKVPLWTFAPWVDVFGGPTSIRAATAQLRALGTPVSAVWSEDWVGAIDTGFGENLSYNWEQDTTRFPDLAGLTTELHTNGFRFLAYMNPYLALGTRAHTEALAKGVVVSDANRNPLQISFLFGAPLFLLDASTSAGREHYAGYVNAAMAAGVDGWMADYGEALPYDAVMNDGTPGAFAHNDYPRSWAETNFSAMRAARPSGDFVTFNRSGSAGISALTSVHWLGDQSVSFDRNDGLGSVLPLYVSSALSGIAITHSDVGGYTSDGNSLVRSDELWTRWLELEAFTPVLRTHHSSFPNKNVQWNSSPATLARFDRYARWHQRLLPYFAALADEAHRTGMPTVRPIWWKSENAAHFAIDQEVLVGDDLLLAPIVDAGARSRSVVFPDGAWRRWRDYDAPLEAALSGETIADAGLEDAVVYLRAGAVIPTLAADVPSIGDTMPEQRLLVVSGASSEGTSAGFSWKLTSSEALPPGPLDGYAGRVIAVSGPTVLEVSVGGVSARFELTSDAPVSLRFE